MKSDMSLDYAVFQLSPKRSRCELIVSSNGNSEKLASGVVKPFVAHLKFAEEQFARAVQSIKLEARKHKLGEKWFTKGTLERFVRFVSTPEILELVNTFDAEMSQLESARSIYSLGAEDQRSGASGDDEAGIAAADATKKELLRAIDVRLATVRQDLSTTYARASAAGFNPDSMSDLQLFADCFGADRLNEACTKFLSLCQRRSDLLQSWKPGAADRGVRSSCESDMSLDEPTEGSSVIHTTEQVNQNRQPTNHELGHWPNHPQVSSFEQPKVFTNLPTQISNMNEKDNEEKDKKDEESPTIQTSQPARRLSVQDRINLFENKQKENTSSSSGGKPFVGKSIELRRLSSDVSSAPVGAEKAVLRRWSGASDMSIDLSADKKDNNGESPLCTPSSASISQVKSSSFSSLSEDTSQRASNDSTGSVRRDSKSGAGKSGDVFMEGQAELQSQVSLSGKEDEEGVGGSISQKDQASLANQNRSFAGNAQQIGINRQESAEEKVNLLSGGDGVRNREPEDSEVQPRGSAYQKGAVGNQATSLTKAGDSLRAGDVMPKSDTGKGINDAAMKDTPLVQSHSRGFHGHSRSFSGQLEGGIGVKARELKEKGSSGDQLTSQPKWRALTGEPEEAGKDLGPPEKLQMLTGESLIPRIKLQKPVIAASDQSKRNQGKMDDTSSSKLTFPGRKSSESRESSAVPSSALQEQVQRVRQSKGNQELNDELKMKANELEKLFAEHKLRVPGDQSSSMRRKPGDSHVEPTMSLQRKKSAVQELAPVQVPEKKLVTDLSANANLVTDFSTPPPIKLLASQNASESLSLRRNLSELTFSDDSRGKFYEKYMQRRDEKLREEWGSKRAEKEAKLKAMHDSFEQNQAEMEAKFSGSAERQQSLSNARHRAEKLRSFNVRANSKEQHIDLIQSEEEELEAHPGDGASRSTQMKKPFPNRSLSSSTPRSLAAPISRSSNKASSAYSGRRKTPLENPLMQSVPNFSDFRKENTKPSSGISKAPARSQVRSYGRSKINGEDLPVLKEEKTRRSESLKKNSASPVEFADLSASNSDDAVLAPLKFDQGQMDHSIYDKYSKNGNSQFFFGKGNGVGSDSGASNARLMTSTASENLINDDDSDDLDYVGDDMVDMQKEEDEEEPETVTVQTFSNGNLRQNQGSDDSIKSGSENDDSFRSLSQLDPASVAGLATSVPSKFHTAGSLKDSPGESPVSWSSRMRNLFSYPHETSDIDASVDSPIGSPASWNSHSLGQSEADAARMRKKWGSAQKPFLVANSSHSHSRKDVTRGFKRLLKFGRKNRGAESLADWISATTSEGDDDNEDGRDPANRSSEDLRKSRMGFLQGHPSDDGFHENELMDEQVEALHSSIPAPPANFKLRESHVSGSSLKAPRSFFSLSSFRSKGSDTKPR